MPEIEDTIKENSNETALLEQLASDETLEITIRKGTNEVILRNPKDNRIVKLKANFEDAIEEKLEEFEDEDEDISPLTPEEFEDGLRKLDALGLTFSVDLLPSIVAKNESSPELINANEFESLQEKYPALPREVGFVYQLGNGMRKTDHAEITSQKRF